MGSSSSSSSLVQFSLQDYRSPPRLPPFSTEVEEHCKRHGCSLELRRLSLPERGYGGKKRSVALDLPREREYLVHEPGLTWERRKGKLPLVLCLHGTDETIKDSELLVQEDSCTSWLDLSHARGFFLVFPQALCFKATDNMPVSWRPIGDNMRSAWQPNHNDELFIQTLLLEMGKKYSVDMSRQYAVGFSNGGLFLSSFLLTQELSSSLAATCNYMGGVDSEQMKKMVNLSSEEVSHFLEQSCVSLIGLAEDRTKTTSDKARKLLSLQFPSNQHKPEEEASASREASCQTSHTDYSQGNDTQTAFLPTLENVFSHPVHWRESTILTTAAVQSRGHTTDDSAKTLPPVYIVTGSSDTNRNYCYNALCIFKHLGYTVYFDDLRKISHEYQSRSTADIWAFFEEHQCQAKD